jgi:hypothetical protein
MKRNSESRWPLVSGFSIIYFLPLPGVGFGRVFPAPDQMSHLLSGRKDTALQCGASGKGRRN